ncbi:MAG: flagellar filament capping protein FliD [Gemmatimonadaceae bacterium]|jgi:flagellar hook-associated protein 2|nr:flagellar filament capping protein FliD [Gemmatimonadaceae bacterium]
MEPTASFSGLASGVQWRDIIDRLMQVEESRKLTPVTRQIDQRAEAKQAWGRFRTLVTDFNAAARAVRQNGIGGFVASAAASPSTSRQLVSVSATTGAAAGRYGVEVLQVAQAAKVSGEAVANAATALGLTGDFQINGRTITVAATDSLTAVRDKINAANTGTNATRVTASILSDRTGGGRLVLSARETGANGLAITDGTGGIARELGFVNSQSRQVPSTTMAIAAALGVQTSPPPASIRVGGQLISIDLATDSIASIVSKINAAGGQAAIASEPNGASTAYRIQVDGNVQAVAGDADSEAILETLGFAAGESAAVRQRVSTSAFTDANDAVAGANTLLTELKVGGVSAGLGVGDAINIRGTRGDGSSVTIGLTIGAGDTLATLVSRINDATAGFGAGSRPAVASVGADGRINLTDGTAGESRLGLSIGISRLDGSSGTLGTTATTMTGRPRLATRGQDAEFRVDGVLFSRSGNTVTDAIPGVSLTLQQAEVGTTVAVTVDRNTNGSVDALKKFTDAYNAIGTFFREQRQVGAALYGNSALRGAVSGFTEALRTQVSGNGTYDRAPLVGISLDRNGVLGIDESVLRRALAEKPDEVEALFGLTGIGTAVVRATDRATAFGTGTISSQERSIDDQTARLDARAADVRRRLEQRRAQLAQEYSRMETALSRLNAQGSWLAGQVRSLQRD